MRVYMIMKGSDFLSLVWEWDEILHTYIDTCPASNSAPC